MKTKLFSITFLGCLFAVAGVAQNTFPASGPVGIGTLSPNASSLLDVTSTSKGVLFPRMTLAQRNAIASPATGLLIYQTTNTPGFYYYTGSAWKAMAPAGVNKTLSNLTAPTAVNASLIPGATGTIDLGTSALRWNNGYFNASVYANGSGSSYGLYGASSSGYAVYGTSGYLGVYGTGGSYGVYGYSSGGYGVTGSSGYIGVYGSGSSYGAYLAGGTYGGYGSGTSYGLYGAGGTYGVYGNSSSYYGVYGNGGTYGVWGNSSYLGVYGVGGTYGLYGSSGYLGTYGTGDTYGVYGYSGTNVGVYGYTGGGGTDESGVYGYCGSYGYGLRGYSYYGSGVYATGGSYAGYFVGPVYASGGYTSSDQKLKKNINDFTNAMDIINKLKPKQYEFRQDGNYQLMKLPTGKHFGLIAQDVEQVLPNLIKETEFDPEMAKPEKPVTDGKKPEQVQQTAKSDMINFKAMNYTELIPIIIKALQELDKENNQLKADLADLKQAMKQNGSISSSSISSAVIGQNFPNPFSKSTTINYSIPKESNSASLVVSQTGSGKIIKTITLSTGSSQIMLDAASLSAGAYTYSLIIDGKKIDTKQMVINR